MLPHECHSGSLRSLLDFVRFRHKHISSVLCTVRNPRDYFSFLDSVEIKQADGTFATFKLDFCRSVDSYVKLKHNQNQLCWSLKKVMRLAVPIRYRA